jgi:ribosomal protein S27AE
MAKEKPAICASCGGTEWKVVPGHHVLMGYLGSEHFPVQPQVCTKCGYVNLYEKRQ